MRLDVFLKRSRLVKRRALAKELCDEGAVQVNDRPARAGKEITAGDRLSVRLWNRLLELEVQSTPESKAAPTDPPSLYRIVSERRIEES